VSNAARSLHDWPLAIAQVTPYPWEVQRDVNEYVERISLELARHGHRMLVLTPSGSRGLVRDSRRFIRAAASDPESLFSDGGVRVLAMGQSLRVTPARPADRARRTASRR
jgi:hypothetical protein